MRNYEQMDEDRCASLIAQLGIVRRSDFQVCVVEICLMHILLGAGQSNVEVLG